ncbi:MAG: hypothetical protein MUF30_11690, partial [Burkholderiales bacterium]|nr:hypothetical protein [Burkholderiales bacterium]
MTARGPAAAAARRRWLRAAIGAAATAGVAPWRAASAAVTERSGAATPAHLDLRVQLDPARRAFVASGTVQLSAGPATRLAFGPQFDVTDLRDATTGTTLATLPAVAGAPAWRVPAATRPRTLRIAWHATLDALPDTDDHRATLAADRAHADLRGSFVPAASRWLPDIDGVAFFTHRIAVDLPDGQKGLVPGDLVDETARDGRWRARFALDVPVPQLDLMAGPYRVDTHTVVSADGARRVTLRTWFTRELALLAPGYLEDAARQLEAYDRSIGPYPYGSFSIVSSPTPTGFGMPTLTYLGEGVLQLPFIRTTSLPHEILHNWWGNGVFVDAARGNWCEGLTTFGADLAMRERESPAAAEALRTGWLRDLSAIEPGADFALTRFTSRTHGASQIVGYHRPAMLFSMLRDALGADTFDAGLRRFYATHRGRMATWDDLRRALEAAAGRALGDRWTPWIERTGLPSPRLATARALRAADGTHALEVAITHAGDAFALDLPLRVRTDGPDVDARIALPAARIGTTTRHTLIVGAAAPRAVLLDPQFRVLRRLAPGEAPPILRLAMVHPRPALRVVGADAAFATA